MLQIVVGNIRSRLQGDVNDAICFNLTNRLTYRLKDSYYVAGAVNQKRHELLRDLGPEVLAKAQVWDGSISLFWPENKQFYTGMMSEVLLVLDEAKIQYEIDDRRTVPPQNMPDLKFDPPSWIEKRGYQDWSVRRCIEATRGIIHAATGAGKTLMVTQLIGEIKTAPFLFLVLSVDLMDQAVDTLEQCLKVPIGRIGGGYFDIRDINVMTIQTAVRSLNRTNPKFDITNFQFDEEDPWEEESLAEKNGAAIEALIRSAKGVYFDECVCGDTEVVTENGKMPISEVLSSGSRYVMTHDGKNIVFKPIVKFWNKGKRDTVKIKIRDGRFIICTKEHAILTEKGWKQAKDIRVGDRFLNVSVDAGPFCHLTNIVQENTYSAIKLGKEQSKSGLRNIKNLLNLCHYVFAVAEKRFFRIIKVLTSLLNVLADGNSLGILGGMINNQIGRFIISPQLNWKNKRFLGPALEILDCNGLIQDLVITNLLPITGGVNLNGQLINQNFYTDFLLRLQKEKMEGMENIQLEWSQNVCLPYQKSQKKFMLANERLLRKTFLIHLEILAWLGGFVTMGATAASICHLPCILRDGLGKKMILWLNGLIKTDIIVQLRKIQQKIFFSCDLMLRLHSKLQKKLSSMSQNACSTNWDTVTSVEEHDCRDVFDIEVQDTHCFFANGILVHNCHHVSSETCKEVLFAAKEAFWRFGGSATPYREDGAEKMIQALFGKAQVEIPASWLIKNKFLVKPYIFNVKIKDGAAGHFLSYKKIYKECIVNNVELNKLVARLILFFEERKISSLTLVQQYDQGYNIQEFIPALPFIKGDMAKKGRKIGLQDLRDGKVLSAIATSLADEGLDVKRLQAIIVAGGGKSITRIYQRIGRVLRLFPGKEKAFAIVFSHDGKHLRKHGGRVKNILKSEEEFCIIDSTPDTIFDDIAIHLGETPDTIFG